MTSALQPPAREQVHVWQARLDRPLDDADLLLSGEERERAVRFHRERDRRRFVAVHAFLRCLLARYLDCDPTEILLGRRPGGKPELVADRGRVRFNLSHSGELAVVALGHAREVGVDIEQVAASPPLEQLSHRVLCEAELAELRTLAAGVESQRGLLRAWTRKEAALKARGTGLVDDPAAIEVGTDDGFDRRSIAFAEQGGSSSHWIVASFIPAPGYVGAVAAQGRDIEIRRSQFEMAGLCERR